MGRNALRSYESPGMENLGTGYEDGLEIRFQHTAEYQIRLLVIPRCCHLHERLFQSILLTEVCAAFPPLLLVYQSAMSFHAV